MILDPPVKWTSVITSGVAKSITSICMFDFEFEASKGA